MNAELTMVKSGHLGGYIQGGDPATYCPHLWSWIVEEFDIKSALDVGCGEGHSTRFFAARGCAAQGIDGCEQAIRESVSPNLVKQHDLCKGPYCPSRPVDLVWSCELLEHVEERYLPHVLQTLSAARRMIVVTHAFPLQKGHHHVNCRFSHYWIRRIESLGFTCDVAATLQARTITLQDFADVNHFARSGLVFMRTRDQRENSGPLSPFWSAWTKALRINQLSKVRRLARSIRRTKGAQLSRPNLHARGDQA